MQEKILPYENIDREFKLVYVADIKKTVVAFANTEGGKIYIGVQDNAEIVGVDDADSVMQQAANALKDAIAPDIMPFVSIRAIEHHEHMIVEIRVQVGSNRPYYLKEKGLKPSGVYVRKGSSNQPLSEEGIRRMLLDNSGSSFEELRSLRQDLTFAALESRFQEKHLPLQYAQMQTLKLIGEDGLYTNLAFLLSDQCDYSLKVAVFQGSSKAVFRDRQEFSGSVLQQLYDVYDYLLKYNKVKAVFNGLQRTDIMDYPEEALREALLNCLVHRDYSYSGSTLINIYDDRMEFISLGGLLPGMELETILIGVSRSRNPNLANIFYRLKLIESYGTGIEKILNSYADSGRKVEIVPVYGAFKLVLPNVNEPRVVIRAYDGRYMVNDPVAPYGNEADRREDAAENYQHGSASYRRKALLEDDELVLQYAQEHGYVTRKQVEELLQVKTTKAYNVLQSLCEQNKMDAVGVGKSRKYILK